MQHPSMTLLIIVFLTHMMSRRATARPTIEVLASTDKMKRSKKGKLKTLERMKRVRLKVRNLD